MKVVYAIAITFVVVLIGIAFFTSEPQPQKTYTPRSYSSSSYSTPTEEYHRNGATKTIPDPSTGKPATVEWYNGHWLRKSGNSASAIERNKKNVDYQNHQKNIRR
jgi:hypothetical protein